jgi:hypothetical protein
MPFGPLFWRRLGLSCSAAARRAGVSVSIKYFTRSFASAS